MAAHQQLQHQSLKGGQLACICQTLQPGLPRLPTCMHQLHLLVVGEREETPANRKQQVKSMQIGRDWHGLVCSCSRGFQGSPPAPQLHLLVGQETKSQYAIEGNMGSAGAGPAAVGLTILILPGAAAWVPMAHHLH